MLGCTARAATVKVTVNGSRQISGDRKRNMVLPFVRVDYHCGHLL